MKRKKVYGGLDFFKVIAAIGIVAIHTKTPVLNTLGRLGVPYFAIVSSMLFFSKYSYLSVSDKLDYLKHFEKRTVLLYFYWQLFYLPSSIVYLVHDLRIYGYSKGILYFIRHFIFPPLPLTNGWGQSWYLVGMLIGLPLVLLIKRMLGGILLTILCLFLSLFYIDYNTYYVYWNWIKYLPHSIIYFLGIIGNNAFPILMIFIGLGLLISKKPFMVDSRSLSQVTILAVISLIMYIGENIFLYIHTGKIDNSMVWMTIPTSVLVVLLGMKLPIIFHREMFWRRFSTFLYCIHVGIIHGIDVIKLILHVNINSFLTLAITILISYLLYLAFDFLINKKKVKWLKRFV